MQDILIKNGDVLFYQDSNIFIDKKDILIQDGKIKQIDNDIINNGYYIIDATNHIVMPGLINTHCHIPMSIFRETSEGLKLYDWLQHKIWPIEDKLTDEDIYWASMLSFIEMISTGTTCVNDHYFMSKSIRKAAVDCNFRTVLTRVLMDSDGYKNLNKRIKEFEELYNSKDINNDLITYTVSPHSLYTCSSYCLEKARDLATQYNLPVHLHFLESIDEINDIYNKHGEIAINVLTKYFNNIHTILAHCVKLTDSDIDILKNLNCGIAHNPVSNLRLGCKIADTTKYIQNGLNVALGTDGQGSGSNLDMFEAMRLACLVQGGIHENEYRLTAKDAIFMATLNGAKLLGLDNKIGSIEVGKYADIILVNNEKNLNNITKLPNLNLVSNLVYNTNGQNVDTTIIKGNILMENRIMRNINVDEIISNCYNILKKNYPFNG